MTTKTKTKASPIKGQGTDDYRTAKMIVETLGKGKQQTVEVYELPMFRRYISRMKGEKEFTTRKLPEGLIRVIRIASFLIMFLLGGICYGQSSKKDTIIVKNGNYIQVKLTPPAHDSTTNKTFTDYEGKVFPVYKNKTGRDYIIRTSGKTGKQYRWYIKIENHE